MAPCLLSIEKKNLIKPPHGEYIAIEKLESQYKNCPLVANILVYATSNCNDVVALIFPNKAALEKRDLPSKGSWHDLCLSDDAKKEVMKALEITWRELKLKSIEKISNIALFPDEWTPDNNWLTAAMKLKRPDIIQNQQATLKRLYTELGGVM